MYHSIKKQETRKPELSAFMLCGNISCSVNPTFRNLCSTLIQMVLLIRNLISGFNVKFQLKLYNRRNFLTSIQSWFTNRSGSTWNRTLILLHCLALAKILDIGTKLCRSSSDLGGQRAMCFAENERKEPVSNILKHLTAQM